MKTIILAALALFATQGLAAPTTMIANTGGVSVAVCGTGQWSGCKKAKRDAEPRNAVLDVLRPRPQSGEKVKRDAEPRNAVLDVLRPRPQSGEKVKRDAEPEKMVLVKSPGPGSSSLATCGLHPDSGCRKAK
ncbi:uncharacterized protein MYCFIDRAFT_75545 [Pseudocercospora fijiensis CIRAD86]|uniref:Uncharacterized protein n=1 Tax=Pseudocercospora fijiensis (strain CIRAD86) TaxID=383855 RepID=N1Q9X7_PSEFD|nr:uncharacterized protein MYCFIDRAFT_75545 [Pseudocercospora fijiensis CIRAD86]EME87702.1 hypothetical protein MYCFIDRAFT_75545 [Pseudocercospora fijiensis CIRAD86]